MLTDHRILEAAVVGATIDGMIHWAPCADALAVVTDVYIAPDVLREAVTHASRRGVTDWSWAAVLIDEALAVESIGSGYNLNTEDA